MLYSHETDYNPCCAEAWLGIRVDWRTGYTSAKICPKCSGHEEAAKEARRLRYVVAECLCERHIAESIAVITADTGPFFLESGA